MGKYYYLCKGTNVRDYKDCVLEKIFSDMKSLEDIDMYTLQFDNYKGLKDSFIKEGLIKSNEDVVIGCYKTDKETKLKYLVPIFHKNMLFSDYLYLLDFNINSYEELAESVSNYVFSYINNLDFIEFIMENYTEKYKEKPKAPIVKSRDINKLNRILNVNLRDELLYNSFQQVCENNILMKTKIHQIYGDLRKYENKKSFYITLLRILDDLNLDDCDRNNIEIQINTLLTLIRDNDDEIYSISIRNLFMNEIYKCNYYDKNISLNGKDYETITIFEPIDYSINKKGLHDLLMLIIDYVKKYEYGLNEELEEAFHDLRIEEMYKFFTGKKKIQDQYKDELMENTKRYVKENVF